MWFLFIMMPLDANLTLVLGGRNLAPEIENGKTLQ
jgi:hypothetical protein